MHGPDIIRSKEQNPHDTDWRETDGSHRYARELQKKTKKKLANFGIVLFSTLLHVCWF